MLLENGPCLLNDDGVSTRRNPHAWTEAFNVLYVDQPAGVGFSYVDTADDPNSYPQRSEEAARDFIAALRLVVLAFPELRAAPIYLTGESYGGRYVPVYAAAILEYNDEATESAQIPLASLVIGNPMISIREQWPSFYDTGCFTRNDMPPIFNASVCADMAAFVDRCEVLMEDCAAASLDPATCLAAGTFCDDHLYAPIHDVHDHELDRAGDERYSVGFRRLALWLNDAAVRMALELPSPNDLSLLVENTIITSRFHQSADYYTPSTQALQAVLARSVEVLIYAGERDWVCNAVGIARLLDTMRWAGHSQFRATPAVALPWKGGAAAGTVHAVEGLAWVQLHKARHLVPFDQPEASLLLVQSWVRRVEAIALGKHNNKISNKWWYMYLFYGLQRIH
jgi:cathepsin A (carboxypeptidase C)